MGLFDFFKAKKRAETEKVTINELKDWIKNKKEQTKNEELLFFKAIESRILRLICEFENEIGILEKRDLKEEKVDEKIKVTVERNLNNYVLHMRNLIISLKSLKKEDVDDLVGKMNFMLFNFEKNSKMNYEKATYLIGEELANTKDSLASFYTDFEKLIKRNSKLIEMSKIMLSIEKGLAEMDRIQKLKSENENKSQDIKMKLKILENEKRRIKNDIEKIKGAKEYLKKARKKEETKNKLDEIDREKRKLQAMIDYNLLAKNFHSSKKRMDIIKKCRNDYKELFLENNWEKIAALLDESRIESNPMHERIKSIFEKQKDVASTITEKDEVDELSLQIQTAISKIKELDYESLKIIKIGNNLGKKNDRIMNSIKSDLAKMGVGLID